MDKPIPLRASNSFSPAQVEELMHALDLRARAYQGAPSKPLLQLVKKVNAMKRTIRRKQRERDAAGSTLGPFTRICPCCSAGSGEACWGSSSYGSIGVDGLHAQRRAVQRVGAR